MRKTATKHAANLAPRLSWLSIDVPTDPRLDRLEVHRGADVVDEATWSRRLPIDGGTYKIIARAPGHDEWSTIITIKPEGDVQTVAIPKLAVCPVVLTRQPTPKTDPPGSHVLSLALAGGAIVLAGGGVGFELAGRDKYDRAKTEVINDKHSDLESAANTRRYIAEGLGVAAIGCAGAAIYLYVRARGNESATRVSRRMHVSPLASTELAGITLNGTW